MYIYLHQIDTHWYVLISAVKIKQFYVLERDRLEIQSIEYTVHLQCKLYNEYYTKPGLQIPEGWGHTSPPPPIICPLSPKTL